MYLVLTLEFSADLLENLKKWQIPAPEESDDEEEDEKAKKDKEEKEKDQETDEKEKQKEKEKEDDADAPADRDQADSVEGHDAIQLVVMDKSDEDSKEKKKDEDEEEKLPANERKFERDWNWEPPATAIIGYLKNPPTPEKEKESGQENSEAFSEFVAQLTDNKGMRVVAARNNSMPSCSLYTHSASIFISN
jgi:hypothetical protein